MSAMKPPPALNQHPRHPRHDWLCFINELNVKYNLGVPISDGLSPSKRKEQETPATRLYIRLEIHFYQGGLEALQQLTKEFDSEARQSCSQWIKKPKGDPDTLPTSGSSPAASNQIERECLQSIFHKVLDRWQPKRNFGRTRSGPAAFSMDKSTSVQPKRAAEAEMNKVPIKRSKLAGQTASAAQAPTPEVLSKPDHLFVTPQGASGGHQPDSNRIERSLQDSFEALRRSTTYSAITTSTTSKSSSRSIFSNPKVEFSTQETVEASSQEQRRTLSTSQDQFPATPATADLLHKSFADHEASFDPRLRDPRHKNATYPLTQTTVYSSPPLSAMEEALRSFSETEPQPQGQGAVTQALSAPQSGSILGQYIWPTFPDWLQPAPFYVAWEVLRIGVHMGVNLNSISLTYSPQWTDQKFLRTTLVEAFGGKALPAASDPAAWAIATGAAPDKNQHLVFAASLEFAGTKSDLPLRLRLQPLKLDKPHRLGRKYGADRFLELLVPSPDTSNLPRFLKDKPFYDELVNWLTKQPHNFCGRRYRPFYLKSGGQRTPPKHLHFGPDPKPVYTDRIFLFAEHGVDIARNAQPSTPVESMLNWALDLKGGRNDSQPVLKLFQRLALVLSKTSPTVLFESSQIRHRPQDLLSPDGNKVMNDGVARMSKKVAKLIQATLGLSSPPCAVQGRLGSAKGMWIIDVTDTTDEIWIETYPSQRKWKCLEATDPEHRTLEVRSWPVEKLRSASLNLQFLPVLEERAIDKDGMRKTIGNLLKENLKLELQEQKESLKSPIEFQRWISSNSAHRADRLLHGHVQFQGGLPQEDEEIIAYMLHSGFDPRRNMFLNEMAYYTQLRRCERLSKKLNIKVGRSAYFFMVVDFHDVLEEGEVHIAFSDRFRADVDDWEGTMVHGVDVLVARSPAHFTSDIQRVKAVFKPELAQLQNVIVFSAKGYTPLADKLSGGDYDGDLCFCVWDDRVVGNFTNAETQVQPDIRKYCRQDKIELRQLLATHDEDSGAAIEEMIEKCFAFNLTKDMLGQATNYKERLCYSRESVGDEVARTLSALLSELVDAPKQGIEFDVQDFRAFKKSLQLPEQLDEPLYKKESWPYKQEPTHILDYLKFRIAQPTIKNELISFKRELDAYNAVHWDKDLTVKHYDQWEHEASTCESAQTIMRCLKRDLGQVSEEWNVLSSDTAISFSEKVQRTYDSWQAIQPSQDVPEETLQRLRRGYALFSEWALLKASTTFKLFYQVKPRLAWHLAGWHLCFIKWQGLSDNQASEGRMPAMLTASMYGVTKIDRRAVNHLVGLETGLEKEADEDGSGEDEV